MATMPCPAPDGGGTPLPVGPSVASRAPRRAPRELTHADLAPYEDKFRASIDETADGHWMWTGTRKTDGYDILRIGSGRIVLARYAALILGGNPRPEGAIAVKTCRASGCIRHWAWTVVPAKVDVPVDAAAIVQPKPDWHRNAACKNSGSDTFFPEKGHSNAAAKRVCAGCTVRVDCLEDALAREDPFGVWGGKSERERRYITRKRRTADRQAVAA